MNIQQAKYHLKRIQTILDLQDKDLSPMDRDILLEDIRKLYELILYSPQPGTQSKPAIEQTIPPAESIDNAYTVEEKSSSEAPVDEVAKNTFTPSETRHTNEEKPIQETDSMPAQSQRLEEEKQEQREIASSRLVTPEQPYKEDPTKNLEKDDTPIKHSTKPVSYPSTDTHPTKDNGQHSETAVIEEKGNIDQYPELFDFKSTEDLSEKLGNSKVEHLNRILAINDKILYINHLYGGEAIPFQESLKKFESFYTYEEAKSYAARELVEQYHWAEKDKISTVQQFMRQVKRLYS